MYFFKSGLLLRCDMIYRALIRSITDLHSWVTCFQLISWAAVDALLAIMDEIFLILINIFTSSLVSKCWFRLNNGYTGYFGSGGMCKNLDKGEVWLSLWDAYFAARNETPETFWLARIHIKSFNILVILKLLLSQLKPALKFYRRSAIADTK